MGKKIDESIFKDRSIVVYISYAPVGFGHLRVADALYHGLPEYVTPILLGTDDTSVTFLHRIVSVHPVLRAIFVWTQRGVREQIFTLFYRRYLHATARNLKRQLIETIFQRIDPVSTVVIMATHFGIAHQISVIKEDIEKKFGIKLVLAVQVTDDSPQRIWYVRHADMIFAPSEKTAETLRSYDKRKTDKKPTVVVTPYPISPYMGHELSASEFEDKKHQAEFEKERDIHMMIPLSGAAVGTKQFEKFMVELREINKRFIFHVVVKDAPYTKMFIDNLEKKSTYIKVYKSKDDKEIVDTYENIYMNEVILIEVTKPSEQAFKALYATHQRGGSILLFAEPVGRQEIDNLDFLRRHKLIPSVTERAALLELATQERPDEKEPMYEAIVNGSKFWRGLELPPDPKQAAIFIEWCQKNGIFRNMMKYRQPVQEPPHKQSEIASDGVEEIWAHIAEFVKRNKHPQE